MKTLIIDKEALRTAIHNHLAEPFALTEIQVKNIAKIMSDRYCCSLSEVISENPRLLKDKEEAEMYNEEYHRLCNLVVYDEDDEPAIMRAEVACYLLWAFFYYPNIAKAETVFELLHYVLKEKLLFS